MSNENDRDYVDEVTRRGGMGSESWLFVVGAVCFVIGLAIVSEHFKKTTVQPDATSLAAHAEFQASKPQQPKPEVEIDLADLPLIGDPIPGIPKAGLGASHSEHTRTIDGQAVNGFSYGNGFQITWQSNNAPTGATPLDVLEAVQSRLRHMQKTKLGGDEVARALWSVNTAVEDLSEALKSNKQSSGGAGFVEPK